MLKKILLSLVLGIAAVFAHAGIALAGTDLSVNCPAIGTCSITPASTPLFNESGWIPGSTVTQKLSITNSSSQSGYAAIQAANYIETLNLGQVVSLQIRQGSPLGTLVYSVSSLQTFKNDGYFTIAPISAGQTLDFYFIATMSPAAGNEYQGSMVKFDLLAGLEIAPIAPPSGGGTGTGSVAGATSPAQPPVCSDTAPSSAPNVTITSSGANTVSLSWTAVSPVTHYALFFTRNSDGAQYGASDIGNVTSYTITQLSGGGASYTFQVMGVNGCAPGPRSNSAVTRAITGAVLAGRPVGPGGQVLGVTTEVSPTPSPSPIPSPTPGQVAGVSTEMCTNWRQYIPWILLLIQFGAVLFFEYRYRHDSGATKHILAIVITVISIVLFYLLRECNCTGNWNLLAWLCKWYWLVSIILTILLKAFSYAFLDESVEKEAKPPKSETPPKTESV
jgi:hypothetical protein